MRIRALRPPRSSSRAALISASMWLGMATCSRRRQRVPANAEQSGIQGMAWWAPAEADRLGAATHRGLWPSNLASPIDGGGIYEAVRRRTLSAFGFAVNLHRFRHSEDLPEDVALPESAMTIDRERRMIGN